MTLTEQDLRHLRRCVALAEESLNEGDQPFGSVLVSAEGAVLAEDHNQIHTNATCILNSRWLSGRRLI